MASASCLSQKLEDEVIESRISRVREKSKVGLFELVRTECRSARWWPTRHGNFGGRVAAKNASFDRPREDGAGR